MHILNQNAYFICVYKFKYINRTTARTLLKDTSLEYCVLIMQNHCGLGYKISTLTVASNLSSDFRLDIFRNINNLIFVKIKRVVISVAKKYMIYVK